jgi:putative ABC transport system substrate-binding protein
MMDPRTWIGTLLGCVLALPLGVNAQTAGKIYRIGYLGNSAISTPESERVWNAFRDTLQERGYVEGSNLVFERRFLEGRVEKAPDFAAELVGLKVDVIVVVNNATAKAAKVATSTIPIVMTGISDPVELGLVASLARPGGNVTGISAFTDDLVPKRLELLKEAVPKAARLAMIRCTQCGSFGAEQQAALYAKQSAAAQVLGTTLLSVELNTPQAFDSATAALVRERPDAVLLGNNPMTGFFRRELAEFAIAQRLPTIAGGREMAIAGALLSFGPRLADNFHGAAIYVDKILKGAKPADLPIEQPTKFEFVINLKTAKALGISIPQNLLLRADEVIR